MVNCFVARIEARIEATRWLIANSQAVVEQSQALVAETRRGLSLHRTEMERQIRIGFDAGWQGISN